MTKFKKIMRVAVLSLFAGVMISSMVFAADPSCGGKYNLSATQGTPGATDGSYYPVKCGNYKIEGSYIDIYGKSLGDCAQAGVYASSPEDCDTQGDLNSLVRTIITTIIFAVGMVAVVMIILGGVSYATSQGDPQKVKKAKDTILYGIIGLVVALLAFAIVNFVLSSIQG